jgi:hypothetical protein
VSNFLFEINRGKIIMNYRNFNKLFIVFIVFFSLVSCSSVKQESSSVSNKITIDGDLDDWDTPLTYYEKEGIRTGFKNDAENLYIAIIINDQNTIKQIKMSGLEFWLDDKGKSNKIIGFKYPIGIAKGMFGSKMDNTRINQRATNMPKDGPPEIEFGFNDRLEEMRLIKTNDLDGSIINLKKTDQITIAIKYENYTLKYEIKIPYKKIDNLFGLNIDYNKELSLGLLTEKPDFKPDKKQGGTKMIGDPDNSNGGMGGSGMRGGGMRGGPSGGAEFGETGSMPTNLDFWVNINLINPTK